EPRHIQVVVRPDETEQVFTRRNQQFLRGLLVDRIQPDNPDQGGVQRLLNSMRKTRRNDDGLLAAVDYVEGKLEYNRPVDQTNWLWGVAIIGGVLVCWAFLVVVRYRLRKHTPPEAGVRVEDESGRSIAVLGGGIGAVSGQWLFDRITGRWRRPAAEATAAAGSAPPRDPNPGGHCST